MSSRETSLRACDRKAPKLHFDANFLSLTANSDTLSLSSWDVVQNLCLSAITIGAGSKCPCNSCDNRVNVLVFGLSGSHNVLQQFISIWTDNSWKNIHLLIVVDAIRCHVGFETIDIITNFSEFSTKGPILPMSAAIFTLFLDFGPHLRRQFCILKDIRRDRWETRVVHNYLFRYCIILPHVTYKYHTHQMLNCSYSHWFACS